jgi:hypothetical protein
MFKATTLLRNFGTLLATLSIAVLAQTALAEMPGSSAPGPSLSLPQPDFHFKGEARHQAFHELQPLRIDLGKEKR